MRSFPRLDAGQDDGFNLIEVLVSIGILGIGVVGLLVGLMTYIGTSGRHHDQAIASTVLVSALEAVKSDKVNPYVSSTSAGVGCATTSSYSLATVSVPSGWSAPVINSVQFWNGSAFQTTCYDNSTNGLYLQQIKVTVTSPDGKTSETDTIVKRKPT